MNQTQELSIAKAELSALQEGLENIRDYADSPKFSAGTYINKNDVLLRCQEGVYARHEPPDSPGVS